LKVENATTDNMKLKTVILISLGYHMGFNFRWW